MLISKVFNPFHQALTRRVATTSILSCSIARNAQVWKHTARLYTTQGDQNILNETRSEKNRAIAAEEYETVPGMVKQNSLEEQDKLLPEWQGLGFPHSILLQLAQHFPHVREPTEAQLLFFLSVSSGNEVYLKDDMGRGKTLAIALEALKLALQERKSDSRSQKGPRIIIIVPTPHLAHQIFDLLYKLSPPASSSTPLITLLTPGLVAKGDKLPYYPLPDTPIVISTAKNMSQFNVSHTPALTHIFLDEPDTLLGPLPSRHTSSRNLSSHPLIRHPPPIVSILTSLLDITITSHGKLDFSRRRDETNTIWTSATLTRDFKRFLKTRGWVRRGNRVVDLDFTQNASTNKKIFRQKILEAVGAADHAAGLDRFERDARQKKPEHNVMLVNPVTGDMVPMDRDTPSMAQPSSIIPSIKLHPFILENFALLHSVDPPPAGTYSLALPPEGVSLEQVGRDLDELNIPTSILTPEVLQFGLPSFSSSTTQAEGRGEAASLPILLAARSSIPGIHLPLLHRVYLLSGMDVSSLTPAQRKNRGMESRVTFYDIVTGRLGRLGMTTDVEATAKVGEQKVVSIVLAETEEHTSLYKMFFPDSKQSSLDNGADTETEGERQPRRKLGRWDMRLLDDIFETKDSTSRTDEGKLE
ncbi:hypothetical protein L204_100187 [Cryptococcus depauperatus]|nr:hypothetical protein L204_02333 [Cryptococcus depauperatus CBS 7855]